MILLREIQSGDLNALEGFSNIPGLFNIPADQDILKQRIQQSHKSFLGQNPVLSENKFIFIAEDLEQRRVVGTSMIASQHGTEESPHFYFNVGTEQKFSNTINTGFIHGTLELKFDVNGPSEIGGLVIDPEFQNSDQKIGRQIAFVRFLFLGTHLQLFKKEVIAELLPPLNKKGQSPLWEAIGRRFTNMDYWEADQLCQKNKEFIFSLFPMTKIYTTFLSAEARNAIGKVGNKTLPIFHMLKKIGFEYRSQVDPFDGGPHLWAKAEEIRPIKKIKKGRILKKNIDPATAESGLIALSKQKPGQFRAVHCAAVYEDGKIIFADENLLDETMAVLGIKAEDELHFMPYY